MQDGCEASLVRIWHQVQDSHNGTLKGEGQ
jgi:hypothetical protein